MLEKIISGVAALAVAATIVTTTPEIVEAFDSSVGEVTIQNDGGGIMPLALMGYTAEAWANGGTYGASYWTPSDNTTSWFNIRSSYSRLYNASMRLAMGIKAPYEAGKTYTITWSGLQGYYSSSYTSTYPSDGYTFTASKNSLATVSWTSGFSLYADHGVVLANNLPASGSIEITLVDNAEFLGLGFTTPGVTNSLTGSQYKTGSIGGPSFTISIVEVPQEDPYIPWLGQIVTAVNMLAGQIAGGSNAQQAILQGMASDLGEIKDVVADPTDMAINQSMQENKEAFADTFLPGGSNNTNENGTSASVTPEQIEQVGEVSQNAQEMIDAGGSVDDAFSWASDSSLFSWFSDQTMQDLDGTAPAGVDDLDLVSYYEDLLADLQSQADADGFIMTRW